MNFKKVNLAGGLGQTSKENMKHIGTSGKKVVAR